MGKHPASPAPLPLPKRNAAITERKLIFLVSLGLHEIGNWGVSLGSLIFHIGDKYPYHFPCLLGVSAPRSPPQEECSQDREETDPPCS